MRLLRIASAIMLIVTFMLTALPAAAEPLAQGCEGLVNANFEGGYSERGAGELTVADGWHPWWQDGPFQEDGYNRRPEFKPEDAHRFGDRRVHSGRFSQKFFTTFSTHNGGLLQQVGGIPVGTRATFSAWAQVWSSQHHDTNTVVDPGNYRVYVGIDPTGGTDWRSPNIVWSEPRIEYNNWMQLSVTAVAQANTITVYLRGQPEFRTQFNDSYWDDACLQLVRPAPTRTPTPRPTNTPVDTPTPTDTPTPENTPTPTDTPIPPEANICVRVVDEGEQALAGAHITFGIQQGQVLATHVTEAKDEPYCFKTREEGNYTLIRENPAGYDSTSPDNWAFHVVPGTDMDFHFSAVLAPTPTPTHTDTPVPTNTPTPTNTPIPTNTVVPTKTPTLHLVPPATVTPVEQGLGLSLFGYSGLFVAVIGVALVFGARIIKPRS